MNAEAEAPVLLRADASGVATLTMNRPAALNALSRPLIAALKGAMDEIHEDRSVHVVVIEGAGRSFCPGHDLREVRGTPTKAFYEALFAECSEMMLRIRSLRQPVIAKVHGVAAAAGCQLVASCDLAVAEATARFLTPGVNIGLFCSTPMVALSRAVPRKQAMRMLLAGEMVGADEALRTGLISDIAPEGELSAVTDALAARIASKSPLTLAIGKEAFYRQIEMGLEDAYAYAGEVMVANMLARDAEEGIDAFIEKREPVWRGE